MTSLTTHLPAWLGTAISTARAVRVEFAQGHFVEVHPVQRRYITDCPEDQLSPLVAAVPQRVNPVHDVLTPGEGRSLGQLNWVMLLHSVRSQPRHRHFRFQQVYLQSWPQLSDVPIEVLPMVSRICALLARRSTTASLVPLILDLPQEEVFALIEVVRLHGNLRLEGPPMEDTSAGAEPATAEAEALFVSTPEPSAGPVPNTSLVRKLWQRLLGGRTG